MTFTLSSNTRKYLAPKCSISIDGISLTVNRVLKDSFNISIIPYTWENTSLKNSKIGDMFNIEIDMLARYVHKALKMKSNLSSIKEIVSDLSKGKMVVIVDDENRENEGDLIFSASHVNPEKLILWLNMQGFNLFSFR